MSNFKYLSFTIVLILSLMICGCAQNKKISMMEEDLKKLEIQVKELRRANSEYNIRIEKLMTEILLLENEISPSKSISSDDTEEILITEPQKEEPESTNQFMIRQIEPEKTKPAIEQIEVTELIENETVSMEDTTSGNKGDTAQTKPEFQKEQPEEKQTTILKSDTGLYNEGYENYSQENFDKAESIFKELIDNYPESDYADNAQYWIGECYYDQKNYTKAIEEFSKVKEKFPYGNKVPDALLKLGYCYFEIDDPTNGQKTLEYLIINFPDTYASEKAKEKLKSMGMR